MGRFGVGGDGLRCMCCMVDLEYGGLFGDGWGCGRCMVIWRASGVTFLLESLLCKITAPRWTRLICQATVEAGKGFFK
jgi:hypothetical protein